jgi:long-chain acyl-CoA synthetase
MRLDDCLTRAARIWPDRVATCYLGKSRTWRQVHDDVRRIAGGLSSFGVGPGDRVALLGENSDRYVDGLFAASWLGAVVVPLNTRLSRSELAECVRDSGARVLLAGDACPEIAVGLGGDCRDLRFAVYIGRRSTPAGFLAWEDVMSAGPCDRALGEGELAAGIFYTGGTTGQPKGVVLSHGNLIANAWHILPALGWGSDTIFLHAAPMFHLADICCLVAVSVVAGQHVIVPGFDAETVITAVGDHGVTALGLVPTMINALTTAMAGRMLPSLKCLLYGGSPMAEELIARTQRVLPGVDLWQAYGQTEAAPILTLLPPHQHVPGPAGRPQSAGLPVPGCEISIRDPETRAELPRGQTGEICGYGDNVMAGYWNKPDLTARVLRDGWLHTGDAGYLDEDGFLFVTGRLDEMIITGGENVYPAEVENVLYQHPAVAEAAVIGVPDNHWGQRVHAVLVPRTGQVLDIDDVASFCRKRLAGYKCPRSAEVRDTLPKTGAGKVDKRLLAATSASRN